MSVRPVLRPIYWPLVTSTWHSLRPISHQPMGPPVWPVMSAIAPVARLTRSVGCARRIYRFRMGPAWAARSIIALPARLVMSVALARMATAWTRLEVASVWPVLHHAWPATLMAVVSPVCLLLVRSTWHKEPPASSAPILTAPTAIPLWVALVMPVNLVTCCQLELVLKLAEVDVLPALLPRSAPPAWPLTIYPTAHAWDALTLQPVWSAVPLLLQLALLVLMDTSWHPAGVSLASNTAGCVPQPLPAPLSTPPPGTPS